VARLRPPGSSYVPTHRRNRIDVDATDATRRAPMNVRPLRDRILVTRLEEQEQRIGGIIVPDSAKEKPQQGKVVAVGRGRITDKGDIIPLDVQVGDTVLFGKYSGTEIKLDNTDYLILREEEVLGVVEGVREPAMA
jgi:chaperonin GroES